MYVRYNLPVAVVTLLLSIVGSREIASQQSPRLSPLPDSAEAPLWRTGKSEYIAQYKEHRGSDGTVRERWVEATIDLAFHNQTGHEVYLPTCRVVDPPILQKQKNGGWITAYGPFVRDCQGPIVVIAPGERFRYSYNIRGFLPGSNMSPTFDMPVPGVYRVEWLALYRTRASYRPVTDLRDLLPLEQRISNEFRLVEK